MHLIKASATGNDFILVDLLDGPFTLGARAAFVAAICDRHEGVGADGVAFLERSNSADVAWDFFNNDGGRAEMCGNAARAVGLYVSQKLGRPHLSLETVNGIVTINVTSPARIDVTLAPVVEIRVEPEYTFVRAGVPHAVVTLTNPRDPAAMAVLAKDIKARPEFLVEGVNVTFVTTLESDVIESITFERGVEDFTRSCGTGAVAAAVAFAGAREGRPVEVRVPGGTLNVVCVSNRPVLSGPARLIARIDWLLGEEDVAQARPAR